MPPVRPGLSCPRVRRLPQRFEPYHLSHSLSSLDDKSADESGSTSTSSSRMESTSTSSQWVARFFTKTVEESGTSATGTIAQGVKRPAPLSRGVVKNPLPHVIPKEREEQAMLCKWLDSKQLLYTATLGEMLYSAGEFHPTLVSPHCTSTL
jgi:hypothetical protein